MIVVSDTSPLNYLVLCGAEAILPRLFGEIVIPPSVANELAHPAAPEAVRLWISQHPRWVTIRPPLSPDPTLGHLGRGEAEAISLALELNANLILTDDKQARRAAESRRLSCTGTLGVVQRAAELGLLDYQQMCSKLKSTTLRLPPEAKLPPGSHDH